MADPCRECGHSLEVHTEEPITVGNYERTACSVEDCGCDEFIGPGHPQCVRCGSWDGFICICYAR